MLTKLCATWLVVLALLPFTAPFQTCDIADPALGTTNNRAVLVPPTSAPAAFTDDQDSLCGLLTTDRGRLKIVVVSDTAAVSSIFAGFIVTFSTLGACPTNGISGPSMPPAVLRI